MILLWIFMLTGWTEHLTSKKVIFIENAHAEIVSSEIPRGGERTASEVNNIDVNPVGVTADEKSNPSSPQSIIRQVAKEKGFKEVNRLLNLAWCESHWTPNSFNPTNGSNDRGIMQISRKWHPEVSDECAFDIRCATEWTIDKINKGGLSQWMCSHAYLDNNYKIN